MEILDFHSDFEHYTMLDITKINMLGLKADVLLFEI